MYERWWGMPTTVCPPGSPARHTRHVAPWQFCTGRRFPCHSNGTFAPWLVMTHELGSEDAPFGCAEADVSTRILGRRTAPFHLSVFLTASRVVLPKILVLTPFGSLFEYSHDPGLGTRLYIKMPYPTVPGLLRMARGVSSNRGYGVLVSALTVRGPVPCHCIPTCHRKQQTFG